MRHDWSLGTLSRYPAVFLQMTGLPADNDDGKNEAIPFTPEQVATLFAYLDTCKQAGRSATGRFTT